MGTTNSKGEETLKRKFVTNQERRKGISSNTKSWKTETGRQFFLSQESRRSGRSLTFNP